MHKIFKVSLFIIMIVTLVVTGLFIYDRKISCFEIAEYSEEVISKKFIEGKEYTLTTLTSGWHDKVFFIHLYNTSLERDQCNKIITQATYSDLYEINEKYFVKVSGNKFTLEKNIKREAKYFEVEWLTTP